MCRHRTAPHAGAAPPRCGGPGSDEGSVREYSRPAASGHVTDASLFIPGGQPLTSREREVLARIAVGETNKEAARRLGLSARTIEGYRASIMRKVGARNAAELLRRVFSQAAKSKLEA